VVPGRHGTHIACRAGVACSRPIEQFSCCLCSLWYPESARLATIFLVENDIRDICVKDCLASCSVGCELAQSVNKNVREIQKHRHHPPPFPTSESRPWPNSITPPLYRDNFILALSTFPSYSTKRTILAPPGLLCGTIADLDSSLARGR
jgi:hypothetical protein